MPPRLDLLLEQESGSSRPRGRVPWGDAGRRCPHHGRPPFGVSISRLRSVSDPRTRRPHGQPTGRRRLVAQKVPPRKSTHRRVEVASPPLHHRTQARNLLLQAIAYTGNTARSDTGSSPSSCQKASSTHSKKTPTTSSGNNSPKSSRTKTARPPNQEHTYRVTEAEAGEARFQIGP